MKKLRNLLLSVISLGVLHSCAPLNQAAHTTNDAATIARSAWDLKHIIRNW